jgi:hypothetical protein
MDNVVSTGGGIALGARTEMFPGQPLPDLNSMGGPAFAASVRGEAAAGLMAILCNSGLPPRAESVTSMRNIDHPGILRLIDTGVVLWPNDNTRYYALAYQRPLAPRMMIKGDETFPPMSEDAINHYFVAPLIGALSELERVGVVHNAIRPTNIFWRPGGASPPQLGECLSAPAGPGQPVLFESLERAMSTPMGRGPGFHTDDSYSLGVTVAILMLGQNPLKGMDDNAIIQLKMERGSFGAIIGNRRLPASHIELLRGLLADDARQRWTAADLEQWLNGRRLTPKNADSGKRAARHIEFASKEYWQVRPLAYAFAAHVGDAAKLIESGTLDKWLRRAMGDEDRANDLNDSLNSLKANGKGANYEEQVVARACIALDPAGPIRYRGIAVLPGGIAGLMAEAILTGSSTQGVAEIISNQLITLWIEAQKEMKTDLVPLGQMYERMRGLIEKSSFGNGLERVVYELNPGLYCLSPFLRTQYVTTPKAVLPALEHMASSGNRPREPMDRHLAAFLIVRDRRSELLFDAMTAPETSPRRGLALLTLFSEMQSRYGPDSLPGLAQWLMPILDPSIQRYLSKNIKEKLQAQLKDTVQRGDLAALLRLVDDPKRIERDQQEFMAARMLYLNILKEVAHIEHRLANRDIIVSSMGKPVAATLATFVAIIFGVVTIIRAIWQYMF